jgi:hypothetical protein
VPQKTPDFQQVDIDSLQQTQPRSVGVEQMGLQILEQLGFVEKLRGVGINGVMRAAILGNLIARMAHPASELSQPPMPKHSADAPRRSAAIAPG